MYGSLWQKRLQGWKFNFIHSNMKDDIILIYNTDDGKSSVSLYAKDGSIWMNQNQLAELFATSKQNIGQHIKIILEDNELDQISVVKDYFTTASEKQIICKL